MRILDYGAGTSRAGLLHTLFNVKRYYSGLPIVIEATKFNVSSVCSDDGIVAGR